MFSVPDKEENRDNGGYLLYEELLSFDGSSENASQLDPGLWYTAGIWRKRYGFCTGGTGFWIIKKMYSDGNRAFRLYQSPFYKAG